MKIEVKRRRTKVLRSQSWFWRIVGDNNEVMAVSEKFTNKQDAVRSAAKAQDGMRNAEFVIDDDAS